MNKIKLDIESQDTLNTVVVGTLKKRLKAFIKENDVELRVKRANINEITGEPVKEGFYCFDCTIEGPHDTETFQVTEDNDKAPELHDILHGLIVYTLGLTMNMFVDIPMMEEVVVMNSKKLENVLGLPRVRNLVDIVIPDQAKLKEN